MFFSLWLLAVCFSTGLTTLWVQWGLLWMKVRFWKAIFFFNVVFLEPEPIKEVNERQTAAGLWIGNDLWVNWTSQETVNRQLTFILANLHLLELKIQRETWRRMTEHTCQTSKYRKILNPELHEIMSVNYMKLHIWPDIKRDRIYSDIVS